MGRFIRITGVAQGWGLFIMSVVTATTIYLLQTVPAVLPYKIGTRTCIRLCERDYRIWMKVLEKVYRWWYPYGPILLSQSNVNVGVNADLRSRPFCRVRIKALLVTTSGLQND